MGAEASRPAGLSVADFTSCFFKVSGDAAKREPLTQLSSGELPLTADDASVQYIQALMKARDPALMALQLAVTQADPGVARCERPAAWWASYFAAVSALADSGVGASSTRAPLRPSKAGETASAAPAHAVADEDEDELVLWDYSECFTYRVPPRPSAAGYVALAWGLDNPVLTARIYVTASSSSISIALWQQPTASGAGQASAATAAAASGRLSLAPALRGAKLLAVCNIPLRKDLPRGVRASPEELLPHPLAYWLEPVRDSSRYFVLRTSAGLLGIGFRDRRHSYDLKSCLQDHLALLARQTGALEGVRDDAPRSASAKGGEGPGVASASASQPAAPTAPSGFELKQGERLVLKLPGKPKQPTQSSGPAAVSDGEEEEWGDFAAPEAAPEAAAVEPSAATEPEALPHPPTPPAQE